MTEMVCLDCKGRGVKTAFYNEVIDAHGIFYDQDMTREIRSIKVECRSCKGTGKANKEAQDG